MQLLFLLYSLLRLTTALPNGQPDMLNLQPRQRSCAVNYELTDGKTDFNQGFCAHIANTDPGGTAYGDIVGLDFNFKPETKICGFHVYVDDGCQTCARRTLNKTSVEVGPSGLACVSQRDNGGWWGSIKAAPCDGTGIGCWEAGSNGNGPGH